MYGRGQRRERRQWFQFPSNGKARVNNNRSGRTCSRNFVSIPFKREGTCEQHHATAAKNIYAVASIPFKREGTCEQVIAEEETDDGTVFQFPSNGKAHVNRKKKAKRRKEHFVSIPFKREGTCEPPNTGNESDLFKFQFPSNGKAHVNHPGAQAPEYRGKVSIPFKREGTCELPLFCTQSGRGSVHPKTKRELREAFLAQKFGAKIP